MLARDLVKVGRAHAATDYCGGDMPAVITMDGANRSCNCLDCAMQLASKVMEDRCELLTGGGRHG